MVHAEIITIGDELLIGQIVNTNAAYLGRELGSAGIPVLRETTVGDDAQRLLAEFRRAWKASDVIIVTGGLGPTHDDISKAAVAKFFRAPMAIHPPTLRAVRERFAKLGYKTMPEINVGQAMVPKGFQALKNERGTAPGLLYFKSGKTFIILPGVPLEMEAIVTESVIPFLKRKYRGQLLAIRHKTLLTTGIGESLLAEKVGDPSDFLGTASTLAFLPRATGVRLRISTRARTSAGAAREIKRIEGILRQRAGKYIFGSEDETIEATIVRLLKEQRKTLSTAESCTGGLISTMITSVDGASAVFNGTIVSYHNDVKVRELGVKPATLKEFGAVSEETAREMAEGALERLRTDFALSVTGIAGPDGGTKEKPVGTIWIALAERGRPSIAKKLSLDFGRTANRERSAAAALDILRRRLLSQTA